MDSDGLARWVRRARELLRQRRSAAIGDEMIGQVLSGSASGPDDIWPHPAVRDLVEELASGDLERGVEIGRYNSGGVSTRAVDEGGVQKWAPAEGYERHAGAIADGWPPTAAMLRRMVATYRAEAMRWDQEADRHLELGE